MKPLKACIFILSCLVFFLPGSAAFSQQPGNSPQPDSIDQSVIQWMKEKKIPGASLVLVNGQQTIIRNYGSTGNSRGDKVTSNTLFEIGSCSKAFTAMAVMQLVTNGTLHLDKSVTDYLTWFRPTYKGVAATITLRQLLHHTSGIPWETIADIPEDDRPGALGRTVRKLSAVKLHHKPGKEFEYATVNYDILAFIIAETTGYTFERYLQDSVINRLGLTATSVGVPADEAFMATGFKMGFLHAFPYQAPRYAGNNAAGYVISNATDIQKWLMFQMGLFPAPLYPLAVATQQRDETVPLHGMAAYAMGWNVSLNGSGEIYHDGLNPNFSTYIAFRKKQQLGIALLTNVNNSSTQLMGDRILRMLASDEIKKEGFPDDSNDGVYTLISLVLAIYILSLVAAMVFMCIQVARKKRIYERLTVKRITKAGMALLAGLPFLAGVYCIPAAMAGFNWEAAIVWSPFSFKIMVMLILSAFLVSYIAYLLGFLFPAKNELYSTMPKVLVLSIFSGIANMIIIALVTSSSANKDADLKFLMLYYVLALCVYLLGRRFVQINLIRTTRNMVFDLRLKMIGKIFSTSYQRFEKIDSGRIYTVLNDDVTMIGESANTMVSLVTSVFTTITAFLYLAVISFWATILTVSLIVLISVIYYFVSKSTNIYFEQARETRNTFITLVNGMIDGFKEISLHRNKKAAYKQDIAATADEYRKKISIANIYFVNAFLVGESLLVVLLGIIALIVPKLFPGIQSYTIISFVVVLLYLIAPINEILNAVPSIMQLKVAWSRIQQFLKDIPEGIAPVNVIPATSTQLEEFRIEDLRFQYRAEEGQYGFEVGPLDLTLKAGEILFIIGGNGSGKTTLAKLLTGLYLPDEGNIYVNGEIISGERLSECFSAVFSPVYLFDKIYNIDTTEKAADIDRYLHLLHLTDKVTVTDNRYSTIRLSGGQRKRLALMQCYLEDAPICLFDEWAADQDPAYRNFFYRILLPQMKKAGKMVIAITHDDHYFDAADKVMEMKQGRLYSWKGQYADIVKNI